MYNLVVVSEFVFITCIVLDVDRSRRPRADVIAHDLNQTRHPSFNPKINQEASGWHRPQP